MRKSKFTASQIMEALNQAESGEPVPELSASASAAIATKRSSVMKNAEIAHWLLRLTRWQRNWGFGLCFLYLRNVKGYGWNHKRVYRIYRELELNMRIKPKKRIVRETPQPLSVPTTANEAWSMELMRGRPVTMSLMMVGAFDY